MNRRGFLGVLFSALAAPFVPALKPKPLEFGFVENFRWVESAGFNRAADLNEQWVAFIHPDIERDIRDMAAREAWAHAHRSWRVAGCPELGPREIRARYRAVAMPAETGRIKSFRFIGNL